jgi:small subunit ribosomal protein S3
MGQKVNPIGIRLGIVREEDSVWYSSSKDYGNYLNTDLKVRSYLEGKLSNAAISRIKIERPAKNAKITIYAARPGVIIGKKGGDIDMLRKELSLMMGIPVHLNIEEVRKPDLSAKLVAENIAQQLVRRIMFRKAMKRAVQNTMRAGALGVKVCISGRLGGTEIARSEGCHEGRIPLHTLRADIDYGLAEAKTTYGIIGVKVWIYRGEKFAQEKEKSGSPKSNKAK